MNKNLKLIVERARGSVPSGLTTEQWIDYYNQSFAELIIDECLNQCYNRGMNDELYAGQLRAAEYIEKHFGLKQIRKCDVCDCMYPCSALRNEKPWD